MSQQSTPVAKLPNERSTTNRTNHKSNDVVYPQLGLKVLFVGSCFLSGAISMFHQAACTRASSVEDADLVVFLGGEDVDPQLYGEKAMRGTYFSAARDEREIDVFVECASSDTPMFGICRGMQFLHVMNGGKLWQHVDKHAISGTHPIIDVQTGEVLHASSMHHQMCIENDSTFPLAYSKGISGRYQAFNNELASDRYDELEAAVYPGINAVAVQGHPEVSGTPEYTAWCLRKVEEFLNELDKLGSNSGRIDISAIPGRIIQGN